MKPKPEFLGQPRKFWAYVRTISQQNKYTQRGTRRVKVHDINAIRTSLAKLELNDEEVVAELKPTVFGQLLVDYFEYRADVLNDYVEPRLLSKDSARDLFNETRSKLQPNCPLPMNKQKGEKKGEAYFTCIINMIVEDAIGGARCDYDPRELTTVTKNGKPLRTLARRVDGAFPGPVDPVAIWEIKEYYYTTTFGSRVADGVYETLLDGMELEELREQEDIDVKHYLMVDDHYTWWSCGRSYLCRIVDMLNMGLVDEVLFGKEVLERLPDLAREWVALLKKRTEAPPVSH